MTVERAPPKLRTWGKRHAFRGEFRTVAEIATTLGVSCSIVKARLRRGVSLDSPERKRLIPYAGFDGHERNW